MSHKRSEILAPSRLLSIPLSLSPWRLLMVNHRSTHRTEGREGQFGGEWPDTSRDKEGGTDSGWGLNESSSGTSGNLFTKTLMTFGVVISETFSMENASPVERESKSHHSSQEPWNSSISHETILSSFFLLYYYSPNTEKWCVLHGFLYPHHGCITAFQSGNRLKLVKQARAIGLVCSSLWGTETAHELGLCFLWYKRMLRSCLWYIVSPRIDSSKINQANDTVTDLGMNDAFTLSEVKTRTRATRISTKSRVRVNVVYSALQFAGEWCASCLHLFSFKLIPRTRSAFVLCFWSVHGQIFNESWVEREGEGEWCLSQWTDVYRLLSNLNKWLVVSFLFTRGYKISILWRVERKQNKSEIEGDNVWYHVCQWCVEESASLLFTISHEPCILVWQLQCNYHWKGKGETW